MNKVNKMKSKTIDIFMCGILIASIKTIKRKIKFGKKRKIIEDHVVVYDEEYEKFKKEGENYGM